MNDAINDIDAISIGEAARRLGIHKNSAYKAALKGTLPAVRVGHRFGADASFQ
jgi:excisionase family DNA binding protein